LRTLPVRAWLRQCGRWDLRYLRGADRQMGRSPAPRSLSWAVVTSRAKDAELDELIEQAVVDAYDDDKQLSGFHVMIEENLGTPFETTVLGVSVTVIKIDLHVGSGIVAICRRQGHTQAIGISDLPLPEPRPAGAEWIDAFRRWAG
jgi:hypothetical protein